MDVYTKTKICNLIRFHYEGDDDLFKSEVEKIMADMKAEGYDDLVLYIRGLMSAENCVVPMEKFDAVPTPCRYCSNHPSNGGSGVCFCVLGTPTVY